MSTSTKFWDKIAAKYARTPVSNEEAYQKKLQISREYLRPDTYLVEFACGTGSTALVHAPYVDRILATDISANMLEIARQKAADAGVENVTFEQVAFDDMEIADGSVDVVMAHSILHLLEDRDAAIATAYRWLKPGGVFISSTACLGDKLWFMRPFLVLAKWIGKAPMVKTFTVAQLTDSIKRAGFDIDQSWLPDKGIAVFIVAKKRP